MTVEELELNKMQNSPKVEDQAIWWAQYLKDKGNNDKATMQRLYEREYNILSEDLEIEMSQNNTDLIIFINAQLDGLDKAGENLGLDTGSPYQEPETSEPEEETPDTDSVENPEVVSDEDTEEKEPEYLVTTSIGADGNTIEEVYKLYKEFVLSGPQGINAALGETLVQNWKNVTNDPLREFGLTVQLVDAAQIKPEKDLFVKLTEHISKKLISDIKEQCALVLEGIKTKSDGKWTNGKL